MIQLQIERTFYLVIIQKLHVQGVKFMALNRINLIWVAGNWQYRVYIIFISFHYFDI